MANWDIELGEDNTRAQIQERRGGDHRYDGIVTTDADVFMYSDAVLSRGIWVSSPT